METCKLSNFMKTLTPWISTDYLRKVYLNDEGHVTVLFTDGVRNVYRINDCNASEIKAVLENLKKQGIKVEA